MHTISVSLAVFKALTERLTSDDQTFDDILRDLLQLDSPLEPEQAGAIQGALLNQLAPLVEMSLKIQRGDGFVSRTLHLPNGTQLRARYKGQMYLAKITDNQWSSSDGSIQSSPSAAARAITGNSVNGLRFWEAMRPSDRNFIRLEKLL
ncbi:DUF2924 domain-containing protein [Novosphingobium sp. B 225]|uniref:DUF2924 domain-containing protein n=1 Tax=Novosphingobium sp. B 225 TaxID=1961849 RepID=UPI000B4B81F5|nr:DUF2924 domain-containing protein [Novosphingobium sp. B 225]